MYNFALEKLPKAFEQFKNKFRVDEKKISYFIFHQANKFMIDGLIQKMKLDKNKVIINLAETGNTTSSSIPIIISRYQKKIKSGQKVLLAGFGGGLSWGLTLLKKN